MKKYAWRKQEKAIYLPKTKPERVDIPTFQFLTLEGEGNPNSDDFPQYIAALYALSYAIKMNPKKGIPLSGYYDYTVYPLEGVWDINEKIKANFDGKINKDDLVFKPALCIRKSIASQNCFKIRCNASFFNFTIAVLC